MKKAVVWSKDNCPYCDQAKGLLKMKGIEFEEKKIGDEYTRDDLLAVAPGARSVPQIFIDDILVGGFQELKNYLNKE